MRLDLCVFERLLSSRQKEIFIEFLMYPQHGRKCLNCRLEHSFLKQNSISSSSSVSYDDMELLIQVTLWRVFCDRIFFLVFYKKYWQMWHNLDQMSSQNLCSDMWNFSNIKRFALISHFWGDDKFFLKQNGTKQLIKFR